MGHPRNRVLLYAAGFVILYFWAKNRSLATGGVNPVPHDTLSGQAITALDPTPAVWYGSVGNPQWAQSVVPSGQYAR